jgi:hypothetical protein
MSEQSIWTADVERRDALGNVATTGRIAGECEYVWTQVCDVAARMQEGDSMRIAVTRELSEGHPLVGVDVAWSRT